MSYYQQEEQPVRNQRVFMSDSFKGCGSELLDCAKNGCIFKSSRGFWQANSCQMALYNLRKDQTRTEYKSFCMAYDKYAES